MTGRDFDSVMRAITPKLYQTLSVCLDVNECETKPCKNGGTCTNTLGNYECKCKPQYTGKHCDQGKPTSYYIISTDCKYISLYSNDVINILGLAVHVTNIFTMSSITGAS